MKRKYFWGAWICILCFASAFAQADTTLGVKSAVDSTTVVNKIGEDSLSSNTDIVPATSGKAYFGAATFYSKKFEGRKTATGETFHHADYTAASNNFKLNTWVRVTNIKNGKSVIVRINDRMAPSMSKKGRIVDLTTAAAKQIGIISVGVGKVKVEMLKDKPEE